LAKAPEDWRAGRLNKKNGATAEAGALAQRFNKAAGEALAGLLSMAAGRAEAGTPANLLHTVVSEVASAAPASAPVETSLRQRRRARRPLAAAVLAELFDRVAAGAVTAARGKAIAKAAAQGATEALLVANLRRVHRDRARPRPASIAGSGRWGGRDEFGAGRTGAAFCCRAFGYGDC
jgi:hypothetical protein